MKNEWVRGALGTALSVSVAGVLTFKLRAHPLGNAVPLIFLIVVLLLAAWLGLNNS
jgi:hypothetical protein